MLVVEIKNKRPSNLIIMKSDLAEHMKFLEDNMLRMFAI